MFPRRHGYVRGESAGLGYKSLDLGPEAKVYQVIPEVMSVVCAVGAYNKKGGGPFFVYALQLVLAHPLTLINLTCFIALPTGMDPIEALAVQLGEDVVLEMARAFIAKRVVQTPPLRARPSPTCTALVEDRMASATVNNLAPLEVAIEVAMASNGVTTSLLTDAISRLEALRAMGEN